MESLSINQCLFHSYVVNAVFLLEFRSSFCTLQDNTTRHDSTVETSDMLS